MPTIVWLFFYDLKLNEIADRCWSLGEAIYNFKSLEFGFPIKTGERPIKMENVRVI
jgi:hypothetical protein